jgi:hypothetical protein
VPSLSLEQQKLPGKNWTVDSLQVEKEVAGVGGGGGGGVMRKAIPAVT